MKHPVERKLRLFFDFDDTLSDYERFGAQYVAALAGVLSLEMGGPAEEWGQAVQYALSAGVERYLERFQGSPLAGYNVWLAEERSRVVTEVFLRAGRIAPDSESAVALAVLLQDRALRGCSALFAGADSALRQLSDRGFTLALASSQESRYLRGAMTGISSFHCIREFYGPDLLDCAKEGPEFYGRLFEAAGIEPGQAVVIDDQVMCLEWADEVGAPVIQACVRETPEPVGTDLYFERFEELIPLIDTLSQAGNLTDDVGIKE